MMSRVNVTESVSRSVKHQMMEFPLCIIYIIFQSTLGSYMIYYISLVLAVAPSLRTSPSTLNPHRESAVHSP